MLVPIFQTIPVESTFVHLQQPMEWLQPRQGSARNSVPHCSVVLVGQLLWGSGTLGSAPHLHGGAEVPELQAAVGVPGQQAPARP